MHSPRVSESAPTDAVRACADAVRALEQSCRPVWANTGPVESKCMGAFWTTHNSPRAPNQRNPISENCTCSSFSNKLYGPVRVQKIIENRTNPQRSHLPSLISVLAMRLIGKQGHKASSYEQRSLNQTELGAHAISVLSCTGSHISCYIFL